MTHVDTATEANLIEMRQPVRAAPPGYDPFGWDNEFLIQDADGKMVLDDAEWLGDDAGETPHSNLEGDEPDEPWWFGERDAPWPTNQETECWFNASLGADMTLALAA